MPEISECYLMSGVHDYLLKLRVADVEALKDFLRNQFVTIEGISETHSSIVLDRVKYTTALDLNSRPLGEKS